MPSFSEKLKHERERRNTPLEDVARRTQIGIQYLEALERGDFDGLPGRRGFGKLYIRAYADLFGFDPEPLISEYDRERHERERPEAPAPGDAPERPRRIRFVPRGQAPPEQGGETPPEQKAKRRPSPPNREAEPSPPPAVPTENPETAAPRTEAVDSASSAPPSFMLPAVPSATPGTFVAVERSPFWNRRMAVVAVVLIMLGAVAISMMTRTSRQPDSPPVELPATAGPTPPESGSFAPAAGEPAAADATEMEQQAFVRDDPVETATPDPQPVAIAPEVVTPPPVEPRSLSVTEFDLGTGVVDRRVVGTSREFEEGAVAAFLTRVRGATQGQTVRHVWIREGRRVQAIELPLGSANWRTFSTKTLWGTGDWAVEARDADGGTLARVEFRCVPSRR